MSTLSQTRASYQHPCVVHVGKRPPAIGLHNRQIILEAIESLQRALKASSDTYADKCLLTASRAIREVRQSRIKP